MSGRDSQDDEEEGATQMMTSRSLIGEARPDTLDLAEEGDLTVPFERGGMFPPPGARPRPAAGAPARAPQESDLELVTSSTTVPMVRDDLPLRPRDFTDSGENTVPRARIPPALQQRPYAPPAQPPAPAQRPAPQYELPPPAYRPPPLRAQAPAQGSDEGLGSTVFLPQAAPGAGQLPTPPPGASPYAQAPGAAQLPTPPPGAGAPYMQPPANMQAPPLGAAQLPTPMPLGAAQLPTPMPLGPAARSPGSMPPPPPPPPSLPASGRGAAPSARSPNLPVPKLRSPPVFVAVMVACTVLTITGLLLLGYLKMRHLW
jgi:hypothetical protein